MLVVVVSMRVKPDRIDEFMEAIEAQAVNSLTLEPGCLRFDVLRQKDDPLAFTLYEIYRDEPAFFEDHRTTPHFAAWAAVAAEVLEGDRTNTQFIPVAPHLMPEAES